MSPGDGAQPALSYASDPEMGGLLGRALNSLGASTYWQLLEALPGPN